MAKFKYKDVLKALNTIVADVPAAYGYASRVEEVVGQAWSPGDGCFYSYHDKPLCIVGQVYFDLVGETIPDTFPWCNDLEYAEYSKLFSTKANRLLGTVQAYQDRGHSWSTSLEMGIGTIEQLNR